MMGSFRNTGVLLSLGVVLGLAACSDDAANGTQDLGDDATTDLDGRDLTADEADTGDALDADSDGDGARDVPGEVIVDLVADAEPDGFFPPLPSAGCIEGGDGARGRIVFDDGQPLERATVALLFSDQKHLGLTDEEGEFFIRAPCGALAVQLGVWETEDHPRYPSLWNLPVGTFDASLEEPTFQIELVTVEGVILDVLRRPIEGAILTAELEDGTTRVFNTQDADENGEFAVNLVPWSTAPYDLTAEGPQDSDKRYRTATLSVLIGDPPPEPSSFTLFEDRCGIQGPIRTSEGIPLEWLYLRVSGDPYPDGAPIYYSFDRGIYYDRTAPDALYNEVPLFCGTQSVQLWNAIWTNPDWPCLDHGHPDQLCLNNYPLFVSEELTEPFEGGFEIPIVRVGGTVYDWNDVPQAGVTVRLEGSYQWGESRFDAWTAFNEVLSGEDGTWSMVMLAQEGVSFRVTTRIRDDDSRPLAAFEGTTTVTGDTTLDIDLEEAPPRCILSGTVHSNEGRPFNEIMLVFAGTDDANESLYVNSPWRFFTEERETWYRSGFPDEEIPFVPFLCGTHDMNLHSIDWESCNLSPDEICFSNWPWWNDYELDEPILDGIEVPVVHLSGRVTTTEGAPVQGASVLAIGGAPPFFFVQNGTGTDADGIYDFVVLPDMGYVVTASVGDLHPMNLDPAEIEVSVTGPTEANLQMPPGPSRCPFSGVVKTSEGVVMDFMDFHHYGVYYGMNGWHFRYFEPGEYYRCTPFGCPAAEGAEILPNLPLICGQQEQHLPAEWTQDFYLDSVYSTRASSCITPTNFDQPCLDFFNWFDDLLLLEPITNDLVVPVVTVSGHVTLEDGTPIQGAEARARATITLEREGGGTRVAGQVSNVTVTRPDGYYEIAVMPSALDEYTVTITTPLSLDLGSITFTEVINADTTVDARFSLSE